MSEIVNETITSNQIETNKQMTLSHKFIGVMLNAEFYDLFALLFCFQLQKHTDILQYNILSKKALHS